MQDSLWHHKLFHFHLPFWIWKVWKRREKIHNDLVTQKISYCKIIYQSCKQCSFFIDEGEFVLIFLDIWSNYLVQNSFSIITEKSLYIFFILYWAFLIKEDKMKYFLVILRRKGMFCEQLLPAPGEKYQEYKGIFLHIQGSK